MEIGENTTIVFIILGSILMLLGMDEYGGWREWLLVVGFGLWLAGPIVGIILQRWSK